MADIIDQAATKTIRNTPCIVNDGQRNQFWLVNRFIEC